jgi:glyoxylase-like metal-dependent hydrolase (beta-lactamase superfamily II)
MTEDAVAAGGIAVLDAGFRGRPGIIATGLIAGAGGRFALVDPGPAASLDGLRRALAERGRRLADLDAVLVTHIHLDHAGGTGALVRENPGVAVFVHERGARHLVDPARLLDSASRLYGDDMDRLWGETVPVPAGNVRILRGGESLEVAGRAVEVAYTPGHASHHVSFFERESRVAFIGDTGGICARGSDYLFPPTPPPDIDVEAWSQSLDRILAWKPASVFVTHFGLVERPGERLEALRQVLFANAEIVRRSLAEEGSDEERLRRFAAGVALELRKHLPEEEAVKYETAVPLEHCWLGLARYWRKRAGRDRSHAERP